MQAALNSDKVSTPLHNHSLSTEDLCMYPNFSDSLQELCTHNPDKFKTFGNRRGLFFPEHHYTSTFQPFNYHDLIVNSPL